MSAETRWLTATEERAWRGLLRMSDLLVNRAGHSMQAGFGLSATDYTVLAELTRTPDGRLRIQELSRVLGWEKSRVSHHLARMVKRGLVAREECADDRRGAYVVVTAAGREAITAAAPRHVEDVRRFFLDHLTPGQITLLAEIADLIIERNAEDR
ncbi:MarR family winged helix-turn-helix transcriptional regulator [Actinoallomurus rhizosphaericola]|uniref:MarR family winged helix-turn-helix transcriptional regulator n=1 Tax=Actinoallomurus rhizosphaericola TaxID=2952536 RepID=UPI002090EBD0|nr:MarR family transcriptional regulator [Actinoallomurus rhizosphaericola]MCO5991995.1 MarR family transcriptional regulator [Actinoallomurus rhizosphaericola]